MTLETIGQSRSYPIRVMHRFREPKKIIVFLLIVLLIALFYSLDLKKYLTLAELKANFETLQAYNAMHPVATATIFIGIFILLSALALPGPLLLCLAAGALFGILRGTLYVTIAATLGATLAFISSRYLFREKIQKRFGKRLAKVNRYLEQEGFTHLLLVRLIPIVPFTLINISAGLTRIRLQSFMLATFVGIIPPGLIMCNAGANLAAITAVSDIMSIKVLGSILLLGILPLTALVRRRLLKKKPGSPEA